MATKVEIGDCIKVYRECARPASVVSGRLLKLENTCNLSTQWTQRDLERSENIKFERNHTVLCGHNIIRNDVPVELGSELIRNTSPSGKLTAIIRKVMPKKGDEEKHYLEVWSKTHKVKNIDLLAQEKHGKVYNQDGQFGCLEWSSSEKQLLYVAEKKRPKTVSYFETKPKEDGGDETAKKDEPVKGEQFVYQDNWGEQFTSKSHPAICIVDIDSEIVKVLDSLPEDISAGQALWSPNDKGIVFVGWWHEPFRLGIIYCTNRKSVVFHADIESGKCEMLSAENKSVRSPRFNADKTRLVYLQSKMGGPHYSSCELMMYNWETKQTSTVVPVVDKPSDADAFPGLFLVNLPQRCWSTDNIRVVLPTVWRSKQELISVNTDTHKVIRLTNDPDIGCWTLMISTMTAWQLLTVHQIDPVPWYWASWHQTTMHQSTALGNHSMKKWSSSVTSRGKSNPSNQKSMPWSQDLPG
ncbi:acylamino-acid-releasing enzyme-like [Ptychodera flava]|uniref:acylamino-acid-releasing enzyme-like n=1 Tax=Ptychodera flava TaxID=63121 RepID=UPI00396A605B